MRGAGRGAARECGHRDVPAHPVDLRDFVDFDEGDAGGGVHAGGEDGIVAGLEGDEEHGVFRGGTRQGEGTDA